MGTLGESWETIQEPKKYLVRNKNKYFQNIPGISNC